MAVMICTSGTRRRSVGVGAKVVKAARPRRKNDVDIDVDLAEHPLRPRIISSSERHSKRQAQSPTHPRTLRQLGRGQLQDQIDPINPYRTFVETVPVSWTSLAAFLCSDHDCKLLGILRRSSSTITCCRRLIMLTLPPGLLQFVLGHAGSQTQASPG